jgi:uncharacterized protein (DUF488 family)
MSDEKGTSISKKNIACGGRKRSEREYHIKRGSLQESVDTCVFLHKNEESQFCTKLLTRNDKNAFSLRTNFFGGLLHETVFYVNRETIENGLDRASHNLNCTLCEEFSRVNV